MQLFQPRSDPIECLASAGLVSVPALPVFNGQAIGCSSTMMSESGVGEQEVLYGHLTATDRMADDALAIWSVDSEHKPEGFQSQFGDGYF